MTGHCPTAVKNAMARMHSQKEETTVRAKSARPGSATDEQPIEFADSAQRISYQCPTRTLVGDSRLRAERVHEKVEENKKLSQGAVTCASSNVPARVVPISIVRARRALRARPNVPRKAIAKMESAGMKLKGSAHDGDCRRHTGPAAPVMSPPHAVPFCGRYETITLVHDLMKKTLPASTRLSLTKAFAPPDWLMPNTAVCTGSHDLTSRLGSLVTRAPIGCVLVRLLLGLLRPFVWGWQTPFAWKTRSRR